MENRSGQVFPIDVVLQSVCFLFPVPHVEIMAHIFISGSFQPSFLQSAFYSMAVKEAAKGVFIMTGCRH